MCNHQAAAALQTVWRLFTNSDSAAALGIAVHAAGQSKIQGFEFILELKVHRLAQELDAF